MAFPDTRHTLIQRLASGGSQVDWQAFMDDYWGPVCRFAMRRGAQLHDAEEIASETFEVLVRRSLLRDWAQEPRAKLRTLLGAVAKRVQANHVRASRRGGRQAVDFAFEALTAEPADGGDDTFYASWVEDLLQRCLDSLVEGYHSEGKGDYVRVLYGRLCEGLTIADVAAALQISHSAVDNYYRHAKQRLTNSLRSSVQSHVLRYSPPVEAEGEFNAEWSRLADHLARHGGLEEAVSRTATQSREMSRGQRKRVQDTLTHCGLGRSGE